MNDENSPPEKRPILPWILGGTALAAWFAMLWFMFGDVL